MLPRLFAFLAMLATTFAVAGPAHARWYEAQSEHFVIYADDSERDIIRFAENLERYHSALEIATRRKVDPPSPSNRVVIFVVGNQNELRRVLDTRSRTIGGMYVPRAGGSRAFVQDIRNQRGYPHFSTVILLHEYAHHFLISTSRFAMPRWLSEGAAEFYASAVFKDDGSIQIGLPAQHRAGELYHADPVSVHELLDPELYERNRGRRYDAFYGRSWLLYHYLTFSEDRTGQLNGYWQSVLAGESGHEVFGDLDQLESDLNRYLRDRRMPAWSISAQHLPIGEISIRPLSRGEAKIIPVRMASQRGVTEERAHELLEDARKIAADFPDDAGVLTALAEAEYDAGNDAEAVAAADRAIAIDPARANAYVQKGYALFRMAEDAEDEDAAFAAAMEPMQALNQRENDHPIPLIYYYRSFVQRGETPPENARAALERAAQLAPFDRGLWLQVAVMQAGEGKIELAKLSLEPLAANPHGGNMAEFAKAMLDQLADAPEGEQFRLRIRRDSAPAVEINPADVEEEEEGDDAPSPTASSSR